jgi:hypothetical protein
MVTAKHTYLRTHAISGKVLTFDLKAEQDDLLHRARTGRAGRAAKTLVKEGPLRIALVALRKGVSLKEHEVAGARAFRSCVGGSLCRPRRDSVICGRGNSLRSTSASPTLRRR